MKSFILENLHQDQTNFFYLYCLYKKFLGFDLYIKLHNFLPQIELDFVEIIHLIKVT